MKPSRRMRAPGDQARQRRTAGIGEEDGEERDGAEELPTEGRGIDVPGEEQAFQHREEGAPDADRQEHADIGPQPVGRGSMATPLRTAGFSLIGGSEPPCRSGFRPPAV